MYGELDYYNKTVFVSVKVEDIVLVPYHICTTVVGANICKTAPLTFGCYRIPFFYCCFGIEIWFLFVKRFQFFV